MAGAWAEGVSMADKMRAALEAARIELEIMGGYKFFHSSKPDDVFPVNNGKLMQQIDEALKSESNPELTTMLEHDNIGVPTPRRLMELLIDTPGKIKGHVQRVTGDTVDIAELVKELAVIELAVSEEILNTPDGKAKYTNEGARNAAKKKALATKTDYQTKSKRKEELEKKLKEEQIEQDYQRDLFRAYLAIAAMGARV